MFGSQVLEAMVGLVMIYLTLSVACAGIKEVIASLFSRRSKALEAVIRKGWDCCTGLGTTNGQNLLTALNA